MKKKLTSIVAVALIAAFLLPSTLINNKTKRTNNTSRTYTCFSIDPPSVE